MLGSHGLLTFFPFRLVLLLKYRKSLQRPQGPLHFISCVCRCECSLHEMPEFPGVARPFRAFLVYLSSWFFE